MHANRNGADRTEWPANMKKKRPKYVMQITTVSACKTVQKRDAFCCKSRNYKNAGTECCVASASAMPALPASCHGCEVKAWQPKGTTRLTQQMQPAEDQKVPADTNCRMRRVSRGTAWALGLAWARMCSAPVRLLSQGDIPFATLRLKPTPRMRAHLGYHTAALVEARACPAAPRPSTAGDTSIHQAGRQLFGKSLRQCERPWCASNRRPEGGNNRRAVQEEYGGWSKTLRL